MDIPGHNDDERGTMMKIVIVIMMLRRTIRTTSQFVLPMYIFRLAYWSCARCSEFSYTTVRTCTSLALLHSGIIVYQ